MTKQPGRLRRLIFLMIPILIGVLILFVLIRTKQGPPRKETVSNVKKVRAIVVVPTDVTPVIHGYGTVQPVNTWQAIAEVSGKAVYVNPKLDKGQPVKKGAVLIKIDPTEYDLSVSESEANIASYTAQEKQLKDTETSNKALLRLEQQTLKLKKNELDRQKRLVSEKVATTSDYENAQSSYIAQQYKVQAIQNSLNSLVAQFELLEAQTRQAEIKLRTARLQLGYTQITAPFDGLVSAVAVEKSQFIQKGQTLAEMEDIQAQEIEAQISGGFHIFRPDQTKANRERRFNENQTLSEIIGIKALVKPVSGSRTIPREGRVMRFTASVDTTTRTPGLIVQVDDPYGLESGIKGPPLVKGVYCEVEFYGKPLKNAIAIPRTAIHPGSQVYVVDENNRLRFRTVEIAFTQEGIAVVSNGLKKGDILIVTDVVPAVDGMAVEPVIDQKLSRKVKTEANRGII